MQNDSKKCAMRNCLCNVADGQKYGSAYCEAAKDETTLECDCGHSACAGQKL